MKNKLAIFFIIISASVLYLLTLHGVAGNPTPQQIKGTLDQAPSPFELSPERGRYAHLIALAQNHTYALNAELANVAVPDVGYHAGTYFAYFAPGIPYLAAPFYQLGAHYNLAQVFSFGFITLVSILGLVFLFKIGREVLALPIWASLAAVMIFGFGTTAWSYAITLYQHHLTSFFILSSIYAVWRYQQHRSGWSWVWALFVWVNYGLAIFVDYPNAILMLPVMVYLLTSSIKVISTQVRATIELRPALLLTMIGFIVITGLHLYHNQVYFGSWSQLSGGLPSYQPATTTDQLIATTAAPKTKNVVGFFREENLYHSFVVLLFSDDRGLFYFMPIFLFSLFGIWYAVRRGISLVMGTMLASVGVNLFLYSSWGDPWGGWAYGPRYLIPSMAILSLFIGVFLVRARYRLAAAFAVFMLFCYSSALALLGALTTNAVPPKSEALGLEGLYNYLLNIRFMQRGQSGSFIYNTYLIHQLPLDVYFGILYLVLVIIMAGILFASHRYDT